MGHRLSLLKKHSFYTTLQDMGSVEKVGRFHALPTLNDLLIDQTEGIKEKL